ncbi:TP53 regulating kinase [Paramecium bursaria]
MNQLISQGAEAKIYIGQFLGDKIIIKQRFPKSYRLKELDDRINRERVKNEAKIMARARKLGINVPYLIEISDYQITMQYIDGVKLKDYINDGGDITILNSVAQVLARLHDGGIIHGDLTTSNMMVQKEYLYLIDFGLSYIKVGSIEDFAVDLYVFEKAFLSTHPNQEENFQINIRNQRNKVTLLLKDWMLLDREEERKLHLVDCYIVQQNIKQITKYIQYNIIIQ